MNRDGSCILAIDNGLTGSLALMSCIPGLAPAALVSMPVMRVPLLHREISRAKASRAKASGEKAKKKVKAMEVNEIDAVALKAIIVGFGVSKIKAVVMEDCPDHGDRTAVMKSMAGSAGKINAVLEILGLGPNTYRIQSHTWQNTMLNGGAKIPQGQTKALALKAAQAAWPHQDWIPTKRSTQPHFGWIDASLIGLYGLRHIRGLADGMGYDAPLVQLLTGGTK